MIDLLYVSYDKDKKRNETGLVVSRRNKDGTSEILNIALHDEADNLYKLLTNHMIEVEKIKIRGSSNANNN